jgi:hypothetical protein
MLYNNLTAIINRGSVFQKNHRGDGMKQFLVIKDKIVWLAIIIVLVCLISACATRRPPAPAKQWYKPNFTQQEWAKDKYECMQQAQQTKAYSTGPTGGGIFYEPGHSESKVVTNWNLYNACMEARGWTLR